MNVLLNLYICFLREKISPLISVRVMYTTYTIVNSQRMSTEIKENGTIAIVRM